MKISVIFAVFLSLLSTLAHGAKVIELNLGHVLSAESHYHAVAQRMAEIAAERSNGALKINIFPSGQLGGESKLIQAARTGAVPLVITGEPPLEGTVREFGLFSLPFLFDDLESANNALQGSFGEHMLGYLDKHNLKGLAWISSQERNIYGDRKINIPDDMKGLKIRVIQSPGYVNTYQEFNAQPTPMAYSEVYLALQTGAINSGESSPDLMIQDKFFEVTKYYNLAKFHYMPCIIIMGKSSLARLSDEHQAIIVDAAKEASKYGLEVYKKDYDESLSKMKEAGIEIVQVDFDKFKTQAQPIYEKLIKDIPEGEKNLSLLKSN